MRRVLPGACLAGTIQAWGRCGVGALAHFSGQLHLFQQVICSPGPCTFRPWLELFLIYAACSYCILSSLFTRVMHFGGGVPG